MIAWLAGLSAGAEPVVIDLDDAPAFTLAEGKGAVTLLLGPSNGSARVAVDYLSFQTGAAVPAHVHADSDEILYVTGGEVALTVAGRELSLNRGNAVLIPAGTEHSAKCTRTAAMIQIYAGPGPEERFRALPPSEKHVLSDPLPDGTFEVSSLDPLREVLALAVTPRGDSPLLHRSSGGYWLVKLEPESPLAAFGLETRDTLLAIAGVKLEGTPDLGAALAAMAGARSVDIAISRRGHEGVLHVVLAK